MFSAFLWTKLFLHRNWKSLLNLFFHMGNRVLGLSLKKKNLLVELDWSKRVQLIVIQTNSKFLSFTRPLIFFLFNNLIQKYFRPHILRCNSLFPQSFMDSWKDLYFMTVNKILLFYKSKLNDKSISPKLVIFMDY